jgi:hypothetical protein
MACGHRPAGRGGGGGAGAGGAARVGPGAGAGGQGRCGGRPADPGLTRGRPALHRAVRAPLSAHAPAPRSHTRPPPQTRTPRPAARTRGLGHEVAHVADAQHRGAELCRDAAGVDEVSGPRRRPRDGGDLWRLRRLPGHGISLRVLGLPLGLEFVPFAQRLCHVVRAQRGERPAERVARRRDGAHVALAQQLGQPAVHDLRAGAGYGMETDAPGGEACVRSVSARRRAGR